MWLYVYVQRVVGDVMQITQVATDVWENTLAYLLELWGWSGNT